MLGPVIRSDVQESVKAQTLCDSCGNRDGSYYAVIGGLLFKASPLAAATAPDIVAPTVSGSINVQNPGSESFWNQLTPI